MENTIQKMGAVCINIYNSHKDGSWRSSSYGWPEGVEISSETIVRDVVPKDECNIAVEICKLFSKDGGLANGPKYMFLPSGIYRQNGSGYNFISKERDIGYTKLDEKSEKLLIDYDCLEVLERICKWFRHKWCHIRLSMNGWVSKMFGRKGDGCIPGCVAVPASADCAEDSK